MKPRETKQPERMFCPGKRFLFQGDSITDGNRGRDGYRSHLLGESYVFLIAARWTGQNPDRDLEFLNRGISGDKVSDLAARWQRDALDLKPEVLSILIGVNDVWRHFDRGEPLEFSKIENTYERLLAETIVALPKVKLVLCEPFILRGSATTEKWDSWSAHILKMQGIVGQLAAKYRAPFVRFQKVFEECCQSAPAAHWLWDGVHPTSAGFQLMADEWLQTVAMV